MGFAESLNNMKKPSSGPRCSVCVVVDKLPVGDQKIIVAAFDNDIYSNADLRRVFIAEGYSFSTGTVGRHRRKECRQ